MFTLLINVQPSFLQNVTSPLSCDIDNAVVTDISKEEEGVEEVLVQYRYSKNLAEVMMNPHVVLGPIALALVLLCSERSQ